MIPKYNEMYRELLEVLQRKESWTKKELQEAMAEELKISLEERNLRYESGAKIYINRIEWACVYLKKAGLVESVKRGVIRITDKGKKLLKSNFNKIDNELIFKDSEELENKEIAQSTKNLKQIKEDDKNQTPEDILEKSFKEINRVLEEDILDEVLRQSPDFFEHLVVKLLQKIGYGSFIPDSGIVTKRSNDEGIDGIIKQDKLGFDTIYIQAKKWDKDITVGRPEIQKFVGALSGKGAKKGLFITTGKFSEEAKKYSQEQHVAKLVLIDGRELAKLMIEYNFGVSVETTYEIKRIDSDFFENID